MGCVTAQSCAKFRHFVSLSGSDGIERPAFLSPSNTSTRVSQSPCRKALQVRGGHNRATLTSTETTRSFGSKLRRHYCVRKERLQLVVPEATPGNPRSIETDKNEQTRPNAVKSKDNSGSGKGMEVSEVGGGEKTQSAAQKAALSALDAQLNTLSEEKEGQRKARRQFAENIARKTGRPVPSESAPSKRTVAGDYLDKGAWDLTKPPTIDFELDSSFFAFTGAALLILTVITNLFLNKFFPVPTREEIRAMRIRDEPNREFEELEQRGTGLNLRAPTLIDR